MIYQYTKSQKMKLKISTEFGPKKILANKETKIVELLHGSYLEGNS